MSKIKKKIVIYILLLILGVVIGYLLYWSDSRPTMFLDDIALGFKGKVTEKYVLKVIHLKVDVDSQVIDIGLLSKELQEQAEVGDSLIKFPNTNCCKLIKDSSSVILKYKAIPQKALERSEYLTRINEQKCD